MTLNVAQVVGAVAGGALYGVRPAFAFLASTAVCCAGVAASFLVRRTRRAAADAKL